MPADDFEIIRPLPFSPPAVHGPAPFRDALRSVPIPLLVVGAAAIAILLAVSTFFWKARLVKLELTPPDLSLEVNAFPRLRMGEHLLLPPGNYSASLELEGYVPETDVPFEIGSTYRQVWTHRLTPLPGHVSFSSRPPGAEVFFESELLGETPFEKQLPVGEKSFNFRHPRYQEVSLRADILGFGRRQEISAELPPNWGEVRLQSIPGGATVFLDDQELGTTPGTFEVTAGAQTFELRLSSYQPGTLQLDVQSRETLTPPALKLAMEHGTLQIRSQPTGANVLINNEFHGSTPLTLDLEPDRAHEIFLSRYGFVDYHERVKVAAGETKEISATLVAEQGEIVIRVHPESAELFANGKFLGIGSQAATLPVGEILIEARSPGYADWKQKVSLADIRQRLDILMLTHKESKISALPVESKTSEGQLMILVKIPPIRVQMGASRRENGFRHDQALHQREIEKPFYLGAREVTNEQFQRFDAAHNSGVYERVDLSGSNHPVVRVSWLNAVAYCNWLSKREGLPLAYRVSGGEVQIKPGVSGYRLPTEAEWALVARRLDRSNPLTFSWGEKLPPPSGTENFADQSASHFLGKAIKDYQDGFAGSAPVGSFAANSLGFYDLSGNVAEWMEDIYSANPGKGSVPLGLDTGHRVIRGTSWLRGSDLVSLRLAHRRFGLDGEADIGFRLARTPENLD